MTCTRADAARCGKASVEFLACDVEALHRRLRKHQSSLCVVTEAVLPIAARIWLGIEELRITRNHRGQRADHGGAKQLVRQNGVRLADPPGQCDLVGEGLGWQRALGVANKAEGEGTG